MSFDELKRTFTITYGMAGAIIMGLFFVFQSWGAIQTTIKNQEVLKVKVDTRANQIMNQLEAHEDRIRELEANHEE